MIVGILNVVDKDQFTTKFKTIRENVQIEIDVGGSENEYLGPRKHVAESFDFNVNHFVTHCGCNVFHWDDVADALYSMDKLFSLEHVSHEGRTRRFQLVSDDIIINIRACGYGTGDYISFSNNADEEFMFGVLRYLARSHNFENKKYHEYRLKNKTKFSEPMYHDKSIIECDAINLLYYKVVTTIKDLFDIVEYIEIMESLSYKEDKTTALKQMRKMHKLDLIQEFLKLKIEVKKEKNDK